MSQEWKITLDLKPVGWLQRIWYQRLHMTPPLAETRRTGDDLARLLPYRWRRFHHWYATSVGLYWIPCPLCGHEFGGHESGDDIPTPGQANTGRSICSRCSIKRNRG